MSTWKAILKFKCFHRLSALIIYLLIGAAIFQKIEKTDEPNKDVAQRIFKATQNKLSLRLGVNISDEVFMMAAEDIAKAAVIRNKPDWTYWRAFDFVFIAISTIGYGDIVPETTLGRGVLIIYALIGLPIVMVTMNGTGKLLSNINMRTIIAIEKRLLKKEEHVYLNIKCYTFSLVSFVTSILITGAVFAHTHEVSYITGLYASFVTLTTIGFGDFRFRAPSDSSAFAVTEVPLTLLSLTIVSCIFNTSVELAGQMHNQIKAGCDAQHNREEDTPATRNELTLEDVISVKPAT
ncbi:potassium channel subfamily K member 5-like [Exaiptasia diaphana]|uniref:Potassium channel domain-containing protein n=1 Tax=Exaiptasia diaphana TaxID=2652724 RepID=A0A913X5D9_EXADI|nr:potassium channel subfamily K member 5-like [Exaiptasia diaphana]